MLAWLFAGVNAANGQSFCAPDGGRGGGFRGGALSTNDARTLASQVLRVQDFADLEASIIARTLSDTSAAAANAGTNSQPSGQFSLDFGAGPGGGMSSGAIKYSWQGFVRPNTNGDTARYQVTVTATSDLVLPDNFQPERSYQIPKGTAWVFSFTWSRGSEGMQYSIQGGVDRWQVSSTQGTVSYQMNFSAFTRIDIDQRTSAGPAGIVTAFWATQSAIGKNPSAHLVETQVLVIDRENGRNLQSASYRIDGRKVEPGFTAQEI